ncbi:glycoside hydrolase family 2 TIM barrel-domain containing protein [Streptomyces sp. NPDC102384]|uniref:glycoside hydrolase family 2 protein n=1 Tax=Streptomyces sp. NPDC102384 TaxID=3366166 RepID=UPI0037FB2535
MVSTRTILNDGWSHRRKVTAFQELAGASGDAWTDVTLPHDALIGTERRADAPGGEANGYFPGGAFEYRRTLTVPEELRGRRVHLEFDGVHRDAVVTVDGALAGQHPYGYSRFHVRLDPFLRFGGESEIRVACRTHLDSRWYAGAGIHRDVHLVITEPVHIALDGVCVTTPVVTADEASVEVAVAVDNDSPTTTTARAHVVLRDATGAEVDADGAPVTLLPGESATARFRLRIESPQRWSAETPYLYTAHVELCDGDHLLDVQDIPVGIRSLQVDPAHGLRVNGETVKLRGACLHADNGPLGVAAIGRAEERKAELLKAAGFNAVRSSHHPASSALLDACDRLGLYVIDETFDMWTQGKSDFDYSADFPQWWERDVEAMVAKDRLHPSVIMYSIGNEIPETGSPAGAVWSRRLAEKVRALDPTRLVTNGINGFVSVLDAVLDGMAGRREAAQESGGVNQMMTGFGAMMAGIQASSMVGERTEEAFAVLDVAGMNYGDARYVPDREQFRHRVIVGTETWPADIDRTWALVDQLPHVIGDFTWTGIDYLGETGIGVIKYAGEAGEGASGFSTPYPGLTAWCGDLDITGHRRTVSYYRETVFGLRTTPYIGVQRPERHDAEVAVATPWSWSDTVSSWSWPGFEGRPVRVEVYSDAEEVELLLDGNRVARAKVGETKAFRADLELRYSSGTLTAVAYSGGVETGRTSLTSAATDELVLTVTADRPELTADTRDLAYVSLELTDCTGVLRPTLDRSVHVEVAGPAVLAALGSAAPVTEESFTDARHRTFDGRALAVVRPTGPGEITVTASADGCETAVVRLQAR